MGNNTTKQEIQLSPQPIRTSYTPPQLDHPSSLLTDAHIKTLHQSLPPVQRKHKKWLLLYSSSQDGLSNISFQSKVLGRGPTIVLIQAVNGNVFGGYASVSWKVHNKFFGDSNCFVFYFKPDGVEIIRPSYINSNYMFFNTGSKFNKCNALGMGGQLGFFTWSLNDDFTGGVCREKCATFKNAPCLCDPVNGEAHFKVSKIEVWGFELSESDKLDLLYKEENRRAKGALEDGEDLFILQSAGIVKGEGLNFKKQG